MSIYSYPYTKLDGEESSLGEYQGKVLLIVNTASKCGFTPQYKGLELLYQTYSERGLVVLGFPCDQFANQEPLDGDDLANFCSLNYGVTFPLSQKIKVRGKEADPLYQYLIQEAPFTGADPSKPESKGFFTKMKGKFPKLFDGDSIKWNFTKFLIDRDGNVVSRFESPVTPDEIAASVEALL
ncbi:glutathione peroxidase [Gottschalkiaceae bacterium SANA]|nr:glutathione peroxidase [Gottschalkiaceae bacterium SANA]